MTEQAIVKKSNGTNLVGFGRRDEIRDLAERLQATMPGGRKLTGAEATSLAQLSMAHGLDPFNGEAWLIPGSGLMVGIKGLRKTARRMAKEEGGTFWTDFQRVEPKKYNEPDNAVVYECYLRDTLTVQAWSTSINAMTTAGVPYPEAIKALGPSPVVIGVGSASPEERSKMDINQRARKRAEADAIKQRYDVSFADFSPEEPEFIEGEYTAQTSAPRSEQEILSELGYEMPSDEQEESEAQDEAESQISEAAWAEWMDLVGEADTLKLEIPAVPENVTIEGLRKLYDELRSGVRAAKAAAN